MHRSAAVAAARAAALAQRTSPLPSQLHHPTASSSSRCSSPQAPHVVLPAGANYVTACSPPNPRRAPRPRLRPPPTSPTAAVNAAATTASSRTRAPPFHSPRRPFSSSPHLRSASGSGGGGGGGVKSPFQVFVDTLREELQKSQQMQENMRQLQGEAGKVQDSETMRRMRDAYERARIVTSIKENPRLQRAAEALRKSGGQVSDAVGATLRQMEESELIKGLSAVSSRLARQLADSTAPVRNTEAYKALSQTLVEAFDDGGSALRVYTDDDADARVARRVKREARLAKIGRSPPLEDVESDEAIRRVMMGTGPTTVAEAAAAAREAAEAAEAAKGKAGAAAGADADAGAGGAKEGEKEEAQPGKGESADSASKSQEGADGPGASSTSTSPSPAPPPRRQGFAARTRGVKENAEAGQALVLKPEPQYKQAWASFKESNPLARRLQELRQSYEESEHPVVERLRSITDTVGGWFQENETARVVGAMRLLDPSFTLDGFQRELREYVVPELIDAYHGAARHLLRQWCGEATYNVLLATIEPLLQKGMTAHGRLLDLRHIDILQARMLDNNVPVLVVSFTSQELMYFKDKKSGEVKVGRDDQPELCRYAMVLTRVEDEMDNEITGGWKVVELARRGQAAFL